MMRFLAFLALCCWVWRPPSAAPIDNKDGFWSEWSDATFERAAAEKKFVIVSLQSWWCPWCHAMNRDTWANPDVRAVLKDHFIPVAVDQDSRPDISQRYERWGWPATIIFGPDGTEIVKLRGFYSPKFFIPILQETIRDPSPVDYGKFGGPERERTLATGLSDSERAEILAFIDKAYDRANGGWSKSKLVDGPTLGWFLDRAKAGDKEAEARIRRSLTAQLALLDKESGGISQVSLKPDWSQPSLEFPMFAQQAALAGLRPRGRAVRRSDLSCGRRPHLRLPQEHARRTGRRLLCLDGHGRGPARSRPAPVCPRDRPGDPGTRSPITTATGEKSALTLAVAAADWALRERSLPGGGFRHAERDAGGPYLADNVEMGTALLALHRSTGERKWLAAANATGDFIAADLHRPQDRRFPRLGLARRQASAQADQAARGQCHGDALLHPARRLYRRARAIARSPRPAWATSPRRRCSMPTASCPTCCWPRRN